jgi:spermidine/putrescine transport system permease protein
LLGEYIVSQFLTARNWPFGSALSFAVMFVMLLATVFYFRAGAKSL